MRRFGAVLALGLVTGGCYHATVETGATPSTQTVEKGWASGWIIGLVPPSTVSTAARCTTGVAKVETQLSFLNQLVGILTLYIYTPMSIKVTCAQGRSGDAGTPTVRVGSEGAPTPEEALTQAAELSRSLRRAVLVAF